MEDDSQRILYRGVELRAPFGFDAFFKTYGANQGIESFCKVVRGHIDTCHTLQTLFQERADAEETYAHKMRKISMKMIAVMKTEHGSVATALQNVATCMSEEAQQHVDIQQMFANTIASSLKSVIKNYESSLKHVEKQRDKMQKKLKEKRSSVKALKKKCFQKIQEGKKDTVKSDGEFFNKSLKLETTRAEYEILTIKTIAILQSIEKFRLTELQSACVAYYNNLSNCVARTNDRVHAIQPIVSSISINSDLLRLADEPPGTGHKFIDQPLPDFPVEEMETVVDKSVRLNSITQYLTWARECLDSETKSKFKLLKALQGMDMKDPQEAVSVEATRNQMIMSSAIQDYLEASQWKFGTFLTALGYECPPSTYRHGHCVIREQDSNGHPASILRMPLTALMQLMTDQLAGALSRAPSPAPPSSPTKQPSAAAPSGYKRAIADYVARQDAEIDIKKGTMVYVILPWHPMWWLVCIDNRVGQVPSNCFGD